MGNSLTALTTLARNWWAFVLRGSIAIGFGLIAWFWPNLALNTLIWLFAFFAFFTGILAIVAAIRAISQRERWLGLAAEGVIGIGAGIITVVWPDLTAKTFLYILAAWAIVTGALSISSAVRLRKEIVGEWALGLSGLALILFGIIAFARPKSGALAVLWLIGLSAIIFGILWVILGLELRRLGGAIQQLQASAAQSRNLGSTSQPDPAARQSGSTTNQGIAAPATSTATARSASAPTAASASASAAATVATAASANAGVQGKSEVVIASAGEASSSQADTESGQPSVPSPEAVAASSNAADLEGLAPMQAQATGGDIAGVAGQATNASESTVDEMDGHGTPSTSDLIVATSDSEDPRPDAVRVDYETELQDAAAAESLAPVVGRSSDGRNAAESQDAPASGMAAEMPRTTRRERALADLVASLPPEGTGWALGNGTLKNPDGYPLKGNASSRIYHAPGGQSYDATIAEICFATPDIARGAGFRPRQGDPGEEESETLPADAAILPPTDESGIVDVAASNETSDLAATEPVEPAPGDIPSEFRSYLVGDSLAESADDTGGSDSDGGVSADSGDTETEAEVAPLGIAAIESAPVDESQRAEAPQRSLSRAEQALQDLIATLTPEGAGWVRGSNVYTTPEGYPVKGNASSRIYHLPGGQNYQATIPEICFATVDDARMNGFRPRHGDPAEADWSLVEVTPESVALDSEHTDISGGAGTSREEQRLQEIIAGLPPEGPDWVRGTGVYTTPSGYPIKGNASSRIYHVPGGQNYQATIPEICFVSIDAARTGGFRPRHGDPAEPDWSLVEVTPGTEPIGIAADPHAADIHPDVAAILASLPSNDAGWRLGDGTLDCPATHPIKGNASSRIFHVKEGRSFKVTIPEFCFATEEDAIAAGFRPARA